MAIKGGNPLFKIETTPLDGLAFRVDVVFPHNGKGFSHTFSPDAELDLYKNAAMMGGTTKTRNTIGAITDATKRTPQDAYDRATALFAAYEEGEWNVGRTGEAAPTGGIVAQAVAEVTQKSVEEVYKHVRDQFAEMTDDKERAKAMRQAWEWIDHPDYPDQRFRAKAAEIRAKLALERAKRAPQSKVSLAGL